MAHATYLASYPGLITPEFVACSTTPPTGDIPNMIELVRFRGKAEIINIFPRRSAQTTSKLVFSFWKMRLGQGSRALNIDTGKIQSRSSLRFLNSGLMGMTSSQ